MSLKISSDSGYDLGPQVTTDKGGNWVAVWQSRDSLGGTIGNDEDILVALAPFVTNTPTATPTDTATRTHTSTETPTQTDTPTDSPAPTQTRTATDTVTLTATPTQTQTPVNTPTHTPTQSPTPEIVSQSVGAGGTVTTDTEADGATAGDSVETTVTTPNAGTITIIEGPITNTPPNGFVFFGQQVEITAPAATAADPLLIVFELDASIIPVGEDQNTIEVFRDGLAVRPCTGAPGVATPDPCVASRILQGDGDVELTILASAASAWNFGVSVGTPDHFKCYKAKDLKNPKFEAQTVALTDQFGVNDGPFEVKKPFLMCNPTDKNGEGISNAADHLTCYKIKGPKLEKIDRPKVEVVSQLGTLQLEAKKPFLLCVPSAKTVLP